LAKRTHNGTNFLLIKNHTKSVPKNHLTHKLQACRHLLGPLMMMNTLGAEKSSVNEPS
jgi:hypothetical protein